MCRRPLTRELTGRVHAKGLVSVSTHTDPAASSERSAEIGPPPYYHRSDCNICREQDGLKTGSELLDTPIPGGYIVQAENFLVEHAPIQKSSAGTVIVEARRHVLDCGEMTATESTELGSVLHRLVPAVKAAREVKRVYYLCRPAGLRRMAEPEDVAVDVLMLAGDDAGWAITANRGNPFGL
jgi:hypothetical protein